MAVNKKTIQIIIIVAAFGGSGFVLYNGLKGSSSQPSSGGAASAPPMPQAVNKKGAVAGKTLPYGDKMDFEETLSKQNLRYGVVKPLPLDISKDVGIPKESLISSQPAKTSQ
ncbi:MAG: hypothetical protein M1383_00685 [Patescibacteria group bacterium]|nr:hypothetical protein [Patescibacteria group bacterium]